MTGDRAIEPLPARRPGEPPAAPAGLPVLGNVLGGTARPPAGTTSVLLDPSTELPTHKDLAGYAIDDYTRIKHVLTAG